MCPIVLGMQAAAKKFAAHRVRDRAASRNAATGLQTFGVKPDHDLAVMRPNQSLAALTARILGSVERLIEKVKTRPARGAEATRRPALVAALAAFYRRVPVAHVEAGLRTGDF